MTRTEPDGSLTVLADHYDGARLNSPNDIVCQRSGNIWFTDPSFGIHGWWEGAPAPQERPHADVVESRAAPSRKIWAWDVTSHGVLSNKPLHIDAEGAGVLDGIAVDALGNVWCGFGSDGRADAPPDGLDGVRVFNRDGRPIGHSTGQAARRHRNG